MYLRCCLLVVVAAAVVQAASLDKRSDCICQSIELPVCGKDGRDYASRCNALCAGTDEATPGYCLRVEHPIHIPTLRRLSRTSGKWCNCLATTPVCGTKGNTYGNSGCAECFGEEVAHTGECSKEENGVQLPENVPEQLPADIFRRELEAVLQPELAPCACVRSHDPVCGIDGHTYDNADCAKRCSGGEIAHTGKCPNQENGVQLPEYVPEQLPADIFRRKLEAILRPEFSPELYDNDKTAEQLPEAVLLPEFSPELYGNGKTAEQLPAGIERRNSHADRQAPCACVMSYLPVCGNDGRTYDNSDCARNCGTNVFVWRSGTCEDTCSLLACSKDNKEICRGGVRYANKCNFDCLNVSQSTRIEVPSDKRC